MKLNETQTANFCFFDTRFGAMAVLWAKYEGKIKVSRIILSRPGIPVRQALGHLTDADASSSPEIDDLCGRIKDFLNGAAVHFSLDLLGLELCPPFQQKVLLAEYAIPRGKVSTYNLIAGYLQNPRGARAVGTALATNPFPVVIPCHRAIRSDGTLGGYQGGLKMKRDLLEMEGIVFDDSGRVTVEGFFYQKQL